MHSFERALARHALTYPGMTPRDAVKLAVQAEFGGGHMIADEEKSLAYLREECADLLPGDAAPCEDIGGGLCRLDLCAALGKGLSLETVNRMFVSTANQSRGSAEGLEGKLALLTRMCAAGRMPFAPDDLASYLIEYRAMGCPAVSHSEAYRGLYVPHYRVIGGAYARLIDVFARIDALLRGRERVTVAIDGMSASGKSALGSLLATVYEMNLFHMDDFFLTPEMRTPERLAEAGGNVDYERFREQVLRPLSAARPFTYQIYDCSTGERTPSVPVPVRRLNVVEGVYSMHPALRDAYDLAVFLSLSPAEQRERILARNGPEMLERFVSEWIPLETRYFEGLGIRESCGLLIDTSAE